MDDCLTLCVYGLSLDLYLNVDKVSLVLLNIMYILSESLNGNGKRAWRVSCGTQVEKFK